MKKLTAISLSVIFLVLPCSRAHWGIVITMSPPSASGPQLIANATQQATGASTGATTAAVDTTGANLLIVHASCYGGGDAPTISDSKGNTWTARISVGGGTDARSSIWYCYGGTVGSGHTFTISGTNTYAVVYVQAWSGIAASAYDVENGANANATTIQPGSVTPSQNNVLIVSGFSENRGAFTATVDSGFTISNQNSPVGGQAVGGAFAYKILTAGGATNPTWGTLPSAGAIAATQVVFKY